MNWYQELTITNGTMYAGSRWLGSFSSHEAALEAMSIKREQRTVYSERDTYCMTASDLDLLEAIDADEK
ncbi:hypothetical protein WT41_01585 [Burkholderia territorii]|uniref:hypothetical protein n=1 Tax=Burkholderia territorii TaxID=1503055 RepID=UPI000758307D|nr:hypothetical protein [Burkholderia territorii]KWA35768.1 hypothetical protein WT41_01585 [Burkholderia territorii]